MTNALANQSRVETLSTRPLQTEPSRTLLALSEDLGKPPEHRLGLRLTDAIHAEAVSIVRACDDALRPANAETVVKWLTALGKCVVAPGTSDDARSKLTSYAGVLSFPPSCYTQATLRRAAERFKWFPAVAELSELFNDVIAPIKAARFAASRVAKQRPETPRQKEARDRVENPAFKSAMADWEKFKAGIGKGEVA